MSEIRNYEEILKTLESDKRYHVCFLECLEKIQIKRKKDGTHYANKNQTFENATYTGDTKDTIMHPELKVSGRDIKGRWETYTINCYLFIDDMPKDDIRREKAIEASCLKSTYILTTDEIIEKIEQEKERQRSYIANYEEQIRKSKVIFEEVEKKVQFLKDFIKTTTYEFRSDEKKLYPSSLEYALKDYVKYNI